MKREKNIFLFFLGDGIRQWRENKIFQRERVQLFSRFPGVWTVGSRRSKRQSCSTLQGLHVGIGFVDFRQLREVGVFSYLVTSYIKYQENGVWEL